MVMGAVVMVVPDAISAIAVAVAGGSESGVEVDGSGGDGDCDMIGLVSLDTKLVESSTLPGLGRRR